MIQAMAYPIDDFPAPHHPRIIIFSPALILKLKSYK